MMDPRLAKRARIDQVERPGLWNPPRPDSSSEVKSNLSASMSSDDSGTTQGQGLFQPSSELNYCSIETVFGDLEKNLVRDKRGDQLLQGKTTKQDGQRQNGGGNKVPSSLVPYNDDTESEVIETIEIGSSETESEDYDVRISKQVLKSQNNPTPKQEYAGKPAPSDESRALKYQFKFTKLRFHYDNLKKEKVFLQKQNDEKTREVEMMKVTITKQSADLMGLQTELGKRDAQLQIMAGKLEQFESEIASRKEAELYQQNLDLKKRNKELEAALKEAFMDQLKGYNIHKEFLEKSHLAYGYFFGESSNSKEGPREMEPKTKTDKSQ